MTGPARRMRRLASRKSIAAGLVAALALVGLIGPGAAQAAPSTCPATFQVLHDDRVGPMKLPAGPYRITVFDAAKLSCAHASDLFRQFLEDYDGNLPGRWRVRAESGSFARGGGVGFSVAHVGGGGGGSHSGGGGGGRHPSGGASCPGFFHVLHDDHIGELSLPAGQYRITLLAVGRLSCARASTLFTRFLEDFDGVLPGRWILDPETATFMRSSRHVGFRVKAASGLPVDPSGGGSTGTTNARLCPGTFRVLHDDHVGPLQLPAGRYQVIILRAPRQIPCARASTLMTRFLQHTGGTLPGAWVVDAQRGAFTRGQGKRTGFWLTPVR